MYVEKTKALLCCAVPAQLICIFVFTYAKSRFSNDTAQRHTNFYVYGDGHIINTKHADIHADHRRSTFGPTFFFISSFFFHFHLFCEPS